ncbi:DUF748 domain-containing protein [Piscinibacter sp. Jin2]|uniref:DUF748 domain-containing protein n=1 Tax=Aquariibacter lacus TaxID=2801332 RepID=A0A9X1BN99_9BURK|nr:DUF748 domain-containing protein [Piscinibacter lacus]
MLASLALAWTLIASLILPRVLRPQLLDAASQALGAPVRLQALHITPWALAVRLEALEIGPEGQPWLAVDALELNLSSESIWRLAPVLDRLHVQGPRIDLAREADGRLNIAPLLDKLATPPDAPPPPPGKPLRYALNNLSLVDGEVQFRDALSGATHRIEALRLGLPFLSNLPSQVAIEVQPELSARINGSDFAARAQALPFGARPEARLHLAWQQVDLAWWAEALLPLAGSALPQPLPASLQAGRLDLALDLVFQAPEAEDAAPRVQVQGELAVDGLQIAAPGHGGLLHWQRLHLRGLDLEPLAQRLSLAELSLQGPALGLDLPQLRQALARPAPAAAPPAAAPASAPAAAQAPAAEWQWRIDRLRLDEGRVQLGAGLPALDRLPPLALSLPPPPGAKEAPAAGPASAAASAAAASEAPQPTEVLDTVQDPDGPLRLQALSLDVQDLRSAPDAPPARLSLRAVDSRGARLQVAGSVQPAQRALQLDAEVQALGLAPWLQALEPMLPQPLPVKLADGRLGLQARLVQEAAGAGQAAGLAVQNGVLTLAELDLRPTGAPPAAEPAARAARTPRSARAQRPAGPRSALPRPATPAEDRLRLRELRLEGVQLQGLGGPAAPQIDIARLGIDGLNLAATRARSAALPWLAGLAPQAASQPAAARAAPPAASAPPLRWQLGELRCTDCALRFDDAAVQPAATVALDRLQFQLSGLGADLGRSLGFQLDTRAQGAGRLQLAGTLRPQPLQLRSKVDLSALQLAVLQPYLDPYLNILLARAELGARGELQVDGSAKLPVERATWKGQASVERLLALDRLNDAEFVRLKRFSLSGSQIRWTPQRLQADLGSILLDDFYGRVIINADARLNLADIVKREGEQGERSITTPDAEAGAAAAPAAPVPAPAAPAAPAPAVPASPPPELRWTAIELRGGRVDFTDNFIKPNYSAQLTELKGQVSAVAWDDPRPATVALAGKVDSGAPLLIDGTVHPLGARLATDLTARAQGIELTRLSSYSGRYAGYGIEKGTLSVELRYRIEQGQLEASNRIVLNQLTFGDKVDSPDALKLPVQLAVSLLQDRNGVIDIDLPIRGSLDDPQFSVGRVILRVIVNLIGKAITAPFSLIAKAFGGGPGGDDLGDLRFAPGSAELDAAAKAQLDKIAQALADRKGLRLEATGQADPGVDVQGLRQRAIERQIRAAKARASRVAPDSVEVDPAERTKWLEAAYKAADLPGKPRNLIGLQKTLPPEEMEARLAAAVPTAEPQLRALADERGNQVKAYLSAKLPAERVLLTRSRLAEPAAAPAAAASAPAAADAGGPRVIFSIQ